MSHPVPMSRDELLAVLDDIRARVAAGDSLEGYLQYTIPVETPVPLEDFTYPNEPAPRADFAVQAGYRTGNSEGEGSFRLIDGAGAEDDWVHVTGTAGAA